MAGAGVNHLAIGQHHFQPQNVVGGNSIGQGVGTAGILRHVAADRAGLLAGGVGRVIITLIRDGQRKVKIHHSGLHARALVLQINFQDLLHAREDQQDATFRGHRTAA